MGKVIIFKGEAQHQPYNKASDNIDDKSAEIKVLKIIVERSRDNVSQDTTDTAS